MKEKIQNDAVKRSSELLLQGATMLQVSCPQCSNPIYRLRDKTMRCAYCNQRVYFERDLGSEELKEINKIDSPIKLKIDTLMKQLEKEEDPDKIIKLAETIKKLKEIL